MRKKVIISILSIIIVALSIGLGILIKNHYILQESYIENSISKPFTRLASQVSLLDDQLEEFLETDEIAEEELKKLLTNASRTNLYFSDFRNHYNALFKEKDDLAIRNRSFERDFLQVQTNLQFLQDQFQMDEKAELGSSQQLLKESKEILSYYRKLLFPNEEIVLDEQISRTRDFKKSASWKDFIDQLNKEEREGEA